MKRVFVALLAVASLALVTEGCFGGSDQLSKEEFKTKATEIDKRVSDKFDAVFTELEKAKIHGKDSVPQKAKTALAEAAQNPDLTAKDLEEAFSKDDPETPIKELRKLGLWPPEQNQ